MKKHGTALLLLITFYGIAQNKLGKLTVEKIMANPKWMGSSPTNPQWSADGKMLFFRWNPNVIAADSLYFISTENTTPQKATITMRQNQVLANRVNYNHAFTAYVYSLNEDLYYVSAIGNSPVRITQTTEVESSPQFAFDEKKIVFEKNDNLFAWDISSGTTLQLTNFKSGSEIKDLKKEPTNAQEKWLKNDQLENFEVLKQRQDKLEITDSLNKKLRPKELHPIYTDDKTLQDQHISPDGRFVAFTLMKLGGGKSTIVPNYVTETGFTQDISGRSKVGHAQNTYESYIYDREKDTVILIKTDSLPGIKMEPDFVKDYPLKDTAQKKKTAVRAVTIFGPYWSPNGSHALVNIYSQDNKDKWIMLLEPSTGKLSVIDHQRDEAWIDGPGIREYAFNKNCWVDENTCWFQSEVSGYSHLYTYNMATHAKKQLTSGNYEIQDVKPSNDKKYFYITTNEVHPGEKQFYRMAITGGNRERITTMTGSNDVSISPNDKQIAFLYSYSNKPWELYLQPNLPNTKAKQITDKAQSELFKSYAWKDPIVQTIKASDGQLIYVRIYKPANQAASKPAVLFVHGAGYLQNAHKWWSSYFREYMFNNLLADNGYTVMDIDYRGSAGYGRNWRTGIYRFMGGKDLDDEMDAAKFLVDSLGCDTKKIGMYGGSYGGFMTLMALFTKPGKINAGAALRPVTDWAHYNHGYTSNILNEPFNDSLSYKKSSPIYFANGLQDHLLICHGMVDTNVHFEDVVRLQQRLIELHKDNWEVQGYPMEDHGFVEPSSWTDEYKRIFKLFETNLKP